MALPLEMTFFYNVILGSNALFWHDLNGALAHASHHSVLTMIRSAPDAYVIWGRNESCTGRVVHRGTFRLL